MSVQSSVASKMPFHKYKPFPRIEFDSKWSFRSWPDSQITEAPSWCSVDLRDGNQALTNPMNVATKTRMFAGLVAMGFKEIEVGFPSASELEFEFCRKLIEENLVPDDVWLNVLVSARPHLILQTIEALKGAKQVTIHLYSSTSKLQRTVVFGFDREQTKALAVDAVLLIRKLADEHLIPLGTRVRLQYSPESFSATELDFALDVCHSVLSAWGSFSEQPVILNFPATVEMSTPNIFADQIEWMQKHLNPQQQKIISVHPHNDRGTAVAAAELAVAAGAQRVEGCLFGNGERTGNVCLVTLAMNLFSQGVDPKLDLSDMKGITSMYESCCGLQVPPRHPWAGELVYTAFSGSHQDAIKKGLEAVENGSSDFWEVPYLPINPEHIGRSFEAIIRINSQSGKSGRAFVLERYLATSIPRAFQLEFSSAVQRHSDATAKEIGTRKLIKIFKSEFLGVQYPMWLEDYTIENVIQSYKEDQVGSSGDATITSVCETKNEEFSRTTSVGSTVATEPATATSTPSPTLSSPGALSPPPEIQSGSVQLAAKLKLGSKIINLSGTGNGPVDSLVSAVNSFLSSNPTISKELFNFHLTSENNCLLSVCSLVQSATQCGSAAPAMVFVELQLNLPQQPDTQSKCEEGILRCHGVAQSRNTTTANLQAVCCAINRLALAVSETFVVEQGSPKRLRQHAVKI